MRKFVSVLLVMALCLGLFGCGPTGPKETTGSQAPSVPGGTAAPEAKEDVVILFTNDIHTYIDGPLSYDVLAGVKAELEARYGEGNVLLADAGDAIQGTAYGSMDRGMTVVELMNAAGYDVATLGNHEFDYGMEGAAAVIAAAKYEYLSCNFFHEKDGVRGDSVLNASRVFQTPGGLRVAFVGVTTPETITKSTPAYFQDDAGSYIYGISGGEDGTALAADLQQAIDAVAKDADIVIGLGHLGVDPSSSPWTSREVISQVSGLDAFIDGHSHTEVPGDSVQDKNGAAVVLGQTGDYFGAIGMMVIDGETKAISTDMIRCNVLTQVVRDENGDPVLNDYGEEVTEVIGYELSSRLYSGDAWPVDEAVAAIKDGWMKEVDDRLGTKIGESAVILDNYAADGTRLVRSQETNSGDFTADALYYLFDSMGLDVDVAVMNGGGIRNQAVTGELTYKTAKEIHTFGNVACLQTVTGQQLLDALEWGARCAGSGEECGGFLQVAGITYKIDTAWPESTQKDDKGVWIGGPTGGYRVHSVQVYNKETGVYEPLDLKASYNLAGYNYTLRDLGDGFNMFSGAVNVLDYVMEDYMILANYIKGFEGGVVAATNSPLLEKFPNMKLDYATVDGSGRIVMEPADR